jgi:osmoprotectant transport system substrate-binding protein
MRDLKRRARITALIAGLAMATVACGSSDSGGGSGGGGSSSGALSGVSFSVGSKEFTEQLILGQITKLALENAGATVDDKTGITGTTNVRKALTSGQIDMYWEYTGTGYGELLGNEISSAPKDPKQLFEAVKKEDLQKNNIVWTALAPMNDTYAIATSQDAANELGVKTLSDYANLVSSNASDASLCAASEFINRSDGLPGVAKAYGFDPSQVPTSEVDLGIIFTQVPKRDPCNFGEVFATDGRIPANDMVVLQDDKSFFPIYNVALNVTKDVYDAHGKELDAIFDPIAKKLTTDALQKMNADVDVNGMTPDEVASQWLSDNGFTS